MKVVMRRSQDHDLIITYNSVSIENNHVIGARKRSVMINRRYLYIYHTMMDIMNFFCYRNMKESVLVFQSNVPVDAIVLFLGEK